MSLKTTIQEAIIAAMKSHDAVTLAALRMVMSAIKNNEIDKKVENLSDDEVTALIQRQVKQRREAIELYKKGNRQDLVDAEEGELTILSKYLPQQMNESEINKVVDQVIVELGSVGPNDFGMVMKKIMELTKGKTEGNIVAQLVKAKLG